MSPFQIDEWEQSCDEIVNRLADAEQPLPRKVIQLEMLMSSGKIKRRLDTLIENGRVEMTDGPDCRKTYYQLTGGDDE